MTPALPQSPLLSPAALGTLLSTYEFWGTFQIQTLTTPLVLLVDAVALGHSKCLPLSPSPGPHLRVTGQGRAPDSLTLASSTVPPRGQAR